MNILKVELTNEQKVILEECKKSLDKYNQAAVLLSMGGGKSYIAANVFKHLKKNNHKFKALWVTTINDMNKAKALMSDTYFSESITYSTFSKMQKGEDHIKELKNNHQNFDLIVIDEAHHALAKQTYTGIKSLLETFENSKLLVMTATKRRYSDRKHIFEWLTPKLTLDVDYKDRGLKYAVDNGLTCDFVYKTCNVQAIREFNAALKVLKQFSTLYNVFDDLIEQSASLIESYNNDIFNKLGNFIKQDLEFDGSEGDRWFVFYHWISEIEENKENIKEMFRVAYNNPNLNINLIEYHSGIDDDTVVDNIVCEPVPNQVDIIITCNKGAESLHPKNTRGIVMLRNTLSNNLFEQMLGRALEIKEKCNYVKYIYDCVDNRGNISKNETIYNGLQKPDERSVTSAFKNVSSVNNVLKSLEKLYGQSFDVEILDDDIDKMILEFNNIKETFESIKIARQIDEVFKLRAPGGEEYKNILRHGTFSPKGILTIFDNEYNTKYADSFYLIQKKFINGFFGEHFADDEKVKDIYNELYDLFGDVLYITPGILKNEDFKFLDLINIASEVRKFNYDYKNSISKTKELKHKIAKLRALNLKGKLCESYVVFCNRNKIDISGLYSNLIKEVLEHEDVEKYPDITKNFKKINKELSRFREILKTSILNNDEALDILAKEHILTAYYTNNDYALQASTAINITYRDVIRECKRLVTKEDYINAAGIVRALRRIEIFSKEKDAAASILKSISIDAEYPIINLVKRNEEDKVSRYELYVLENLGIRVINNERRNANIRKLIDNTPFGIIYNRFIENPDISDFKRLSLYKIEGLPKYAQSLLRTKAFKTSTENAKQDELFQKDNREVQQAVKSLYYLDTNTINKIKSAINDNKVDSRKLIGYAIPDSIYLKHKGAFDKALTTPWDQLESTTTNVIIKSLSNTEACYDCIIKNLLEAEIVPKEQVRLANELIRITE